MVETAELESATPCMSSKYSNQLSYASVFCFALLLYYNGMKKSIAFFKRVKIRNIYAWMSANVPYFAIFKFGYASVCSRKVAVNRDNAIVVFVLFGHALAHGTLKLALGIFTAARQDTVKDNICV